MKKIITKLLGGCCFFLISMHSFAQSEPMTTPTKASIPLPSIHKTNNPDVVLTEKIQNTITKLPFLKNQAVTAASSNGVVTLEGSINNKDNEEAVIKAVKNIKGVKEVKSKLTIKMIPTK